MRMPALFARIFTALRTDPIPPVPVLPAGLLMLTVPGFCASACATGARFHNADAAAPVDPAAPTNLSYDGLTKKNRPIRNWRDNSADETGFLVFRATTGGFHPLVELPPDITTFADSFADLGITYKYQVCAARQDEGVSSERCDINHFRYTHVFLAPGPVTIGAPARGDLGQEAYDEVSVTVADAPVGPVN